VVVVVVVEQLQMGLLLQLEHQVQQDKEILVVVEAFKQGVVVGILEEAGVVLVQQEQMAPRHKQEMVVLVYLLQLLVQLHIMQVVVVALFTRAVGILGVHPLVDQVLVVVVHQQVQLVQMEQWIQAVVVVVDRIQLLVVTVDLV
jgi:hypothetical protein